MGHRVNRVSGSLGHRVIKCDPVPCLIHTQKVKFKGHSVQKFEWKRADKRTDVGDCNLRALAVGKNLARESSLSVSLRCLLAISKTV